MGTAVLNMFLQSNQVYWYFSRLFLTRRYDFRVRKFYGLVFFRVVF